jgi:hypothetical protein
MRKALWRTPRPYEEGAREDAVPIVGRSSRAAAHVVLVVRPEGCGQLLVAHTTVYRRNDCQLAQLEHLCNGTADCGACSIPEGAGAGWSGVGWDVGGGCGELGGVVGALDP